MSFLARRVRYEAALQQGIMELLDAVVLFRSVARFNWDVAQVEAQTGHMAGCRMCCGKHKALKVLKKGENGTPL